MSKSKVMLLGLLGAAVWCLAKVMKAYDPIAQAREMAWRDIDEIADLCASPRLDALGVHRLETLLSRLQANLDNLQAGQRGAALYRIAQGYKQLEKWRVRSFAGIEAN